MGPATERALHPHRRRAQRDVHTQREGAGSERCPHFAGNRRARLLPWQTVGGAGRAIGVCEVTYIITPNCVDLLDKTCIGECPVDCIYEGDRMLYIHPDECVDCGAWKVVPAFP
jgi:NAD-dependent dihydropyrimidine dehydrogenase PreA subunit